MSRVEPVDPRVRLAIVQWPPDAPRGAVTTFCLEHNISRETFYAIRKRALIDGAAQLTDDIVEQAVGVQAALELGFGSCPGITPQQAWEATPVVAPQRSTPRSSLLPTPDGIRLTRIRDTGTVVVRAIRFQVSRTLAASIAYIVETEHTVQVFDERGALIIEHAWPAPGTNSVGSGKRPGRRATL